jgi:hypothetical protein
MNRLDRVWREQDEGRGEEGGWATRTIEARKWDERPSGQVKGKVTSRPLIPDDLSKIK